MAAQISDDVLEVPIDIVLNSSGLGIDIGGTIGKIVYRSNKEYNQGKPIHKQASTKTGKLHLAMFPRNETDNIIQYISEHCDLKRDEHGEATVYATGVGGSKFQTSFANELRIKIKVLAEFDCFVLAFNKLSKVLPKEEFIHSLSPEAQAFGGEMQKQMEEWMSKFKESAESSESIESITKDLEKQSLENLKPEADVSATLPCLLAMCGSGTGIMLIKEDGTSKLVDGVQMGGRFYLGMMNLLTGEKDYSKLIEMATGRDGKSADTFMSDLRGDTSGTDLYNMSTEFDQMVYPFGKGTTSKREDIKDGDMSYSLYNCLATVHVQIAYLLAAALKVKHVYFCGNFVNSQFARLQFEKVIVAKEMFAPQDLKSDMHFLRHGGLYGAIGAYLHKPKVESPEKATSF